MSSLGVLPGYDRSRAFDVNGSVIVGLCSVAGQSSDTAVVWRRGVIARLQDLVPTPAMTFSAGASISGAGVLCVIGSNVNGDVVSAVLTPVVVWGDLDGDCAVEIDDLLGVISAWGPHEKSPSPADSEHRRTGGHSGFAHRDR